MSGPLIAGIRGPLITGMFRIVQGPLDRPPTIYQLPTTIVRSADYGITRCWGDSRHPAGGRSGVGLEAAEARRPSTVARGAPRKVEGAQAGVVGESLCGAAQGELH